MGYFALPFAQFLKESIGSGQFQTPILVSGGTNMVEIGRFEIPKQIHGMNFA